MSNGFNLFLTDEALRAIEALKTNPSLNKRWKAVGKALAYLQSNPRHPGLNTHKFTSLSGPNGEDVFEAYAENNTPEPTASSGSMAPTSRKSP